MNTIEQQLREKGYFDGPLTGYLSHQLPPDLPPWRAILRISVQVGLIGGVAMGFLFSTAVLALNTYLIHSPIDCLKLFIGLTFGFSYLGCLLFCVTGWLQITLLRFLQKPLSLDHFLAIRSGELAGVLLFFYGASWWWSLAINTGIYALLSWASGLMFLFLFLLAFSLARLVNRLTRYRNDSRVMPRKELAVVALCALSILLFFVRYQSLSESPLSWTTNVSKPEKFPPPLLVIGIDGLSLDNLQYNLNKGNLTHFRNLLEKGTLVPLSGFEGDQASEWISLMTGHSTLVHGIKGLEQTQYPGYIQPLGPEQLWTYFFPFFRHSVLITMQHRRVKFLWEIASEAGFSVTAVNCWGTWPAEPLQGTVFSDRCLPASRTNQFLGQETFPETAFAQIHPLLEKITKTEISSVEKLTESSYWVDHGTQTILDFALESSPQLAVAYFQGYDILQQKMQQLDLQKTEHLEKKLTLQRQYYQFLDQLLGKYLSKYRIVLISGPGFFTRNEGFLLAYGEGFQTLKQKKFSHFLQVMPTLLRSLGLPRCEKMLQEISIFEPSFLQKFPAQTIHSFGRRVPALKKNHASSPSPSYLEEYYRSLGYL